MNTTAAIIPLVDLLTVTFQIVESADIITSSWLHRGDVEPRLEQNIEGVFVLTLHSQGTHGTFELPYILNQVIYADDDLVAVLVAYHGTEAYGRKQQRRVPKGQFWRFYQHNDDGIWSRVEWKHLGDKMRRVVLDSRLDHAPEWTRIPGKLSAEYHTPKRAMVKMTSYKLVQIEGGRYLSVYDRTTEYVLGKTMRERARSRHRGGYFSYPDQEFLLSLFRSEKLFSYDHYREPMQLALLECEIGGRIIEYESGKWASTYLKPTSVLMTMQYVPGTELLLEVPGSR